MRTAAITSLVVALLLALPSCSVRPAQDYVLTGTLKSGGPVMGELQRMIEAGFRANVVMTIRSSPKVQDVLIQRRWVNLRLPMEFGLGKGRGSEFKSDHPEFFVTAQVDLVRPGMNQVAARYVAFSPTPVKAGTLHLDLEIRQRADDAEAMKDPAYPRGGFESITCREEAVPPGMPNRNEADLVFAGEIDVQPEEARARIVGRSINIIARERADRGFPELIKNTSVAAMPLPFALFQGDRQIQDTTRITTPKFVAAVLDIDGNVDTKDDQVRAVTAEAVNPGDRDVRLVLDLTPVLERLGSPAAAGDPHGANAPNGASREGRGKRVAKGRVVLPKDLNDRLTPGVELWLTVRQGSSDGGLVMVAPRVVDPTFPYEFDVFEGDNAMGGAVEVPDRIRVRAILTSKGLMASAAEGALRVTTEPIAAGAEGLELVLQDKD